MRLKNKCTKIFKNHTKIKKMKQFKKAKFVKSDLTLLVKCYRCLKEIFVVSKYL